MIRTVLIAAALSSAAMADETYTTFGNDWGYSLAWPYIAQTLSVPDQATFLESFDFIAKAYHDTVAYTITVYSWDDEGQHVVGDPLHGEFGLMHPVDDPYRHFDIDVLLPPGEKIAIVLSFQYAPGGHAVGAAEDVWTGGAAIATNGPIDQTWILPEETSVNDLIFTAEWTVCTADIYQDGALNIFDFLAFQTLFQNGDMAADFNADGMLNVLDFVAFQAAFLEGC